MRKRRLIVPVLFVVLAFALAQDVPAQLNLDIRVSILESRLGRLESDVAMLVRVPEQLARIETTLQAVAEKTSGQGDILTSIALSVISTLIGVVIAYSMGVKKGASGK